MRQKLNLDPIELHKIDRDTEAIHAALGVLSESLQEIVAGVFAGVEVKIRETIDKASDSALISLKSMRTEFDLGTYIERKPVLWVLSAALVGAVCERTAATLIK